VTLLRPITPADHAQVLAWNHAHVELLAPLDEDRLRALVGWADLGCVIHEQGRDLGFVLTFASGSAYDGENFRWFAEHLEAPDGYYYLDRVVVDPTVRRTGIGTRLYDEIEERARTLASVMCLEVNLDPPNEPSLEFHRRRGYREIGQDGEPGHVLAMMAREL
jgi:hypothetical protein